MDGCPFFRDAFRSQMNSYVMFTMDNIIFETELFCICCVASVVSDPCARHSFCLCLIASAKLVTMDVYFLHDAFGSRMTFVCNVYLDQDHS